MKTRRVETVGFRQACFFQPSLLLLGLPAESGGQSWPHIITAATTAGAPASAASVALSHHGAQLSAARLSF